MKTSTNRIGGEPPAVISAIAAVLTIKCSVRFAMQIDGLSGISDALLAALAGVSGIVLAVIAVQVWRRATPVRPAVVNLIAVIALLQSLAYIAATGDLRQTALLMLTMVAIGAGVTGWRSASTLIAAAALGWVAVAVSRSSLATTSGGELSHSGMQIVIAIVLAAVLYGMRRRRESLLEAALELSANQVAELAGAKSALEESEDRYRNLFVRSPIGIALSDEDGRVVATNPALLTLLGCSESELVGRDGNLFAHPGDRASLHALREAVTSATNGVAQIEIRSLRPDGEVYWALLTSTHTLGPAGQSWTLSQVQDITQRKAAEQALIDSEANLTAVAAVMRRVQSGEDARETIVASAKTLADASHTSLAEPDGLGSLVVTAASDSSLLGSRVTLMATSATVEAYRTGMPLFIADAQAHPLTSPELLKLTGSHSVFCVPVSYRDVVTGVLLVGWDTPMAVLDNRSEQAVRLLADETGVALEHAKLLAELRQRATTDGLTGLLNRRGWENELSRLIESARRTGLPLTVALADLDHFKAYNDSHGHHLGDVLLHAFAANSRAALRSADVLARWGGEEFAVGLADCAVDQGMEVLERIRHVVPNAQTCSIGYASWNGVESAEELMRRVDAALYLAKDSGRDVVRPAQDRDVRPAQDRDGPVLRLAQ